MARIGAGLVLVYWDCFCFMNDCWRVCSVDDRFFMWEKLLVCFRMKKDFLGSLSNLQL